MNSPGRSRAAAAQLVEPPSLPEPASPPAAPMTPGDWAEAEDGEDWHGQEAADTDVEEDADTANNEANPQEEANEAHNEDPPEADADSSDNESNPI